MRGSIVKRQTDGQKARYFVVIEEVAPDGKRKRRWYSDPNTNKAFTAKKMAENELTRLLSSLDQGSYVTPNKVTLSEWAQTWLLIIEPNLKPSAFASCERHMRVHILPNLGSHLIRKLTPEHLDAFYSKLLTSGRADHFKGDSLSSSTVRNIAVTLGKALKDAKKRQIITVNPAEVVDPPKISKESTIKPHAWDAPQLSRFLTETQGEYYWPVWSFLASTGCRRGEALGLRWKDVNLDSGSASIVQTVQKIRGKIVFGATKTTSSQRRIALDQATVQMLRTLRARQAEQRLAVGGAWLDLDLVFTGADGRPHYPETVTRTFGKRVRHLGLPEITLHGLRHTWASLALMAGIHVKVVQERLGHSTVSITLDLYSHVLPVMHDNAAEQVAALVRAAQAT